jgi:predicted acylesterase/phospholipase RssA
MNDKSIDECIEFFKEASKNTFQFPRKLTIGTTKGLMAMGTVDSLFRTTPLERELTKFFQNTSLFGPSINIHFQITTRVAVTTAKDGGEIETIIANYNRPRGDWSRFEREDDISKDMKAFEGGLATAAAPFYFSPFRKGGTDYVDGAVYANCPAGVALDEKEKLWPNNGSSLDILISLGTGSQKREKNKVPWPLRYGFMGPVLKMFERQTNSEMMWERTYDASPDARKSKMHRLNPEIHGKNGKHVELFDWDEEDSLLEQVERWTITEKALLQGLANRLIASLFFFEPSSPQPLDADRPWFTGSIRCRLRHGSEALHRLLARIQGFSYGTVSRDDIPRVSQLADGRWHPIPTHTVFVQEGPTQKFRVSCELPFDGAEGTYQVVIVHLAGEQEKLPISGFPATSHELADRSKSQWLG